MYDIRGASWGRSCQPNKIKTERVVPLNLSKQVVLALTWNLSQAEDFLSNCLKDRSSKTVLFKCQFILEFFLQFCLFSHEMP